MTDEQFRQKHVTGPWYVGISPGNTKGYGGTLVSNFWDDILEKAWLKLQGLSEDNVFVLKVTKFEKDPERWGNFESIDLDCLLYFNKELEDEQPEDSEEFTWDYEEKSRIYKELKQHCYEVMGEDFFKTWDRKVDKEEKESW